MSFAVVEVEEVVVVVEVVWPVLLDVVAVALIPLEVGD